MTTDIGITASRHGLSQVQHDAALVTFLMSARAAGATRFHQGCCVGGDEVGAVLAHNLGFWVIGHPPIKTQWRSQLACGVSNELREPKDYFPRNRHIVDEIGALIGLPDRPEVWRGSGTWYTIHYAQQMDVPRLVMLPNGVVVDRVGMDGLSAPASTDRRIDEQAG